MPIPVLMRILGLLFIFISFNAVAQAELAGFVLKTNWEQFASGAPETPQATDEVAERKVVSNEHGAIYLSHDHAKIHLKKLLHLRDFEGQKLSLRGPVLSMHGVGVLFGVSIADKGIILEVDRGGYIKKLSWKKPWKSRDKSTVDLILAKLKAKVAKR
jgi:hypothetical protein